MAGAALAATQQFVTQAGELKKWENRLGASASELSKMQYAAKVANVEFTALTVGMQRLQRRVGRLQRDPRLVVGGDRPVGAERRRRGGPRRPRHPLT